MACIYKRGRRYYLDYRANGRRIRKSVGTNKKLAELALKELEVQLHKGILPEALPKTEISKFIDEFLASCKATVRPETYRKYSIVLSQFLEFLKNSPFVRLVQHIQTYHIEKYKVERLGKRKPSTVNSDIKCFNTFFNYAKRLGYIAENPVKDVKRVKVPQQRPRFFSKDELKRFFEACSEFDYALFSTLLYTGMRKGELRNLEWEDVDFERRIITIRVKDEWEPKGRQAREIPIHDKIFPVLQRHKEVNGTCRWVFSRKDGSQIVGIYRRFQEIARKAGMDKAKVHTFRHTFASYMVMSGVDLPTVQKLLGHKDITTTMIYAHLAPEHLKSAVSKLEI